MLVPWKNFLLTIQVFAILGVVVVSGRFDDCWNNHKGVCLISSDCTDGFVKPANDMVHSQLCPDRKTCCVPKVPMRVRDIKDDNCGFSTPVRESLSIVNGNIVKPEQFPWYVAIRYEGLNFCGGSILNNKWIISAAHCFTNTIISELSVVAGSRISLENDDVNSRYYQKSGVLSVHMQKFRPKVFRNDIAMLKLSTPLNWTAGVRPVCLPPAMNNTSMLENIDDQVVFSSTGYGGSEKERRPISLRAVHLPGVTLENCLLSNNVSLASTQLCAGYPYGGKDTAKGDSGGPLTRIVKDLQNRERAELAGIVSIGLSIADVDKPGIYTRVSAYIKWINWLMGQ